MMHTTSLTDSGAKRILDLFFSLRTGVMIQDVKSGQVAVATCDRTTYAELGYGYTRVLWMLHCGDRAVISVHPAALAQMSQLVWRFSPDTVLEEDFWTKAMVIMTECIRGPLHQHDLSIKLYHPGGVELLTTEGAIRPVTTTDKFTWPGTRLYWSAGDYPSAQRGECFGIFLGDVLVGDIATHDAPVAEMAELVAEDGIEVAEEYRGRGFGKALLAHWTYEMQRRGRACLHGTCVGNVASVEVARAVGYLEYAKHRAISYSLPDSVE